ncbi:sugar-transfer associated ATP-grasp domain-containing protein [Pseudokineococcus basanitobsidens]|uniref:Sugar-transfer associated ATP-grasp domain-containing protein n=1 Tax=Pseudokineococcus basanitobsidens TaxID=1926649 RepID=A0ABU8RJZ8_9ACTN
MSPSRHRRRLRHELRDTAGAVRYFLRTERALDVAFRSPSMLARGFHSDRRWLLPEGASRRTGYIADLPYARVAHRMNPDALQELLTDKTAFAAALADRGLVDAAPRTLGTLRGGRWQITPGARGPCVAKPTGGSGGRGVRRFDDVPAAVAATDLSTDHLLQEAVRQHPGSAALWPGSLNTVRVLAVRTADGRVVLPSAVQRVGRSTTGAVDNYSSGGMVVPVDPADGVLGPVMSRVRRPGRVLFEDHPETGVRITGRTVPCWRDLVALVHRLMDAFPDAVHVGWDMAVSEDGPVVVEGNARFVGVKLYQLHGPFTHDPGVREFYRSHGLLP